MLGQVCSALFTTKWEGLLLMSLMKYQHLHAEALSVSMLPINYGFTFDSVSKPIEVWMYLWLILLSTLQWTTIPLYVILFFIKKRVSFTASDNFFSPPTRMSLEIKLIKKLMTTIQRTGSVRQQIVSPDLLKERQNCNFDQQELKFFLYGGQEVYEK